MKVEIPKVILELIQQISNKRARIVIDHIIKYGQITTEELEKVYKYNHPPRAARDVREAGIPLITTRVKSSDGRSIAAYKFGDFSTARLDRVQGRINWPKGFKQELVKKYGAVCLISGAVLEPRALQIDHRIPYQIAGDDAKVKELDVADFMLLSGTSNRAKSWSCEHCLNWKKNQDLETCKSCYWAFPEHYNHVAMKQIRQLEITWQNEDVEEYDNLKKESTLAGEPLPNYVKDILKNRKK